MVEKFLCDVGVYARNIKGGMVVGIFTSQSMAHSFSAFSISIPVTVLSFQSVVLAVLQRGRNSCGSCFIALALLAKVYWPRSTPPQRKEGGWESKLLLNILLGPKQNYYWLSRHATVGMRFWYSQNFGVFALRSGPDHLGLLMLCQCRRELSLSNVPALP